MACARGITLTATRMFSTTNSNYGKKNFRKFLLHNRGTIAHKERMKAETSRYPKIPIYKYGVRETGYYNGKKFIEVPEMIPELVVPDLTGFQLKPYVSYRADNIEQPEFTAQDLFIAIYREKIIKDFKDAKLNPDGSPVEPSPEEAMTPEEAKRKARMTGSDIFEPRSPREIFDYPLRY